MKIGCMATYPDRYESLKTTLRSIVPQLDELHLYLNNYSMELFRDLSYYVDGFDNTVQLYHSVEKFGDLKDMGKFYPLLSSFNSFDSDDYIFLLDDDLIYPEDYCQAHIRVIEKHKTVTTVHGRTITNRPMTGLYSHTFAYGFHRYLPEETKVDIAGTGTVAFTHSMLKFEIGIPMRQFMKMADIYFACLCREKSLDILAIARPERWITETGKAEGSIYLENRHDTTKHCKILNHYFK